LLRLVFLEPIHEINDVIVTGILFAKNLSLFASLILCLFAILP